MSNFFDDKKYPNDPRPDSLIDKHKKRIIDKEKERLKNIHIDVEGQSEDALQQKCIFWFHNTYPKLRGLLFAVPNGGARDGKQGKLLKLTGVVSGVSDLMLLYNGRPYCIELKKDEEASLSPKQKKWRDKVEKQNIDYYRIDTLFEFQTLIKNLIG